MSVVFFSLQEQINKEKLLATHCLIKLNELLLHKFLGSWELVSVPLDYKYCKALQ